MFQLHQKWCVFLQLAAEKKTPFLVLLKQNFGPSYFDRALAFVGVASGSRNILQ